MTRAYAVFSDEADSSASARDLTTKLRERLSGASADALIVFAASTHDHEILLRQLADAWPDAEMIGCSSGGEFVKGSGGDGASTVIALNSTAMRFKALSASGLTTDPESAAAAIASDLTGLKDFRYAHRSLLLLTDALAGHASELIRELTSASGGAYKIFGAGASDGAKFKSTPVFIGTQVMTDAVVALEILSEKPIGIGVAHGWTPATPPMRVTESTNQRLVSLNSAPAVEAFIGEAHRVGHTFDQAEPLPFFLHHVIGVKEGDRYRIRVPLAVSENGAVECAADVPKNGLACLMTASPESTADAAQAAATSAVSQLEGNQACFALVFDCVATRVRLGSNGFSDQLAALESVVGDLEYAGFNSYGQFVRTAGQADGFHNCNALVCLLPS